MERALCQSTGNDERLSKVGLAVEVEPDRDIAGGPFREYYAAVRESGDDAKRFKKVAHLGVALPAVGVKAWQKQTSRRVG